MSTQTGALRWVRVFCICAVCAISVSAAADSGEPTARERDRNDRDTREVAREVTREKPVDKPRERGEAEPPFALGLDMVVGFGKLLTVTSTDTLVLTPATAVSTVLLAGYAVTEALEVSVHVPFTVGTINPPTVPERSSFAFGNPELEAEYRLKLAPGIRLTFALGISVPIAQGSEVPTPEELAREPSERPSRKDIDRGALQFVAAASRGFEDEALFEINRFGIVPKVRLEYRYGRLLLRPYMTIENLISTEKESRAALIEWLMGTYVGAALGKHIDVGARLWADFVLAGEGATVGVVEPQVAAHVGDFKVTLGGIVPFAGKITDPQFGGIRAAFGGRI